MVSSRCDASGAEPAGSCAAGTKIAAFACRTSTKTRLAGRGRCCGLGPNRNDSGLEIAVWDQTAMPADPARDGPHKTGSAGSCWSSDPHPASIGHEPHLSGRFSCGSCPMETRSTRPRRRTARRTPMPTRPTNQQPQPGPVVAPGINVPDPADSRQKCRVRQHPQVSREPAPTSPEGGRVAAARAQRVPTTAPESRPTGTRGQGRRSRRGAGRAQRGSWTAGVGRLRAAATATTRISPTDLPGETAPPGESTRRPSARTSARRRPTRRPPAGTRPSS